MMRVLVACEFSGVVRRAFRKRGHDAYSCDLLQATDKSIYHIQQDITQGNILRQGWDMLIAHPPCTYLTISAAWAYGDGPYHQKVKPDTLVGEARREARRHAIEFVEMLWDSGIERICIENPIGYLSTMSKLGKPEWPRGQVIQPYNFDEDASKATCLWLKNLPMLRNTKYVPPRISKDGKPRWGNQTDSGQNKLSPHENRSSDRAITYKGIAEAMAQQWNF